MALMSLLVTTCVSGQGQDTIPKTKVDNELLEKVNYMSWKARELDTITQYQKEQIKGLSFWIKIYDEVIDTMDLKIQKLDDLNFNLSRENTLLIEDNDRLLANDSKLSKSNLDCNKRNEKLEKDNTRLKSARNRSLVTNVGLAGLLVVTVIAIVTDDD
jgi:CRISPR/Cas system-associated endonuclease/helicase Cas3